MTDPVDRERARARLILILIALLQLWATRFSISPDGLSYLDLADGWDHNDATLSVNAYWSPAYPFLIGAAKSTLVPTAAWESLLVRAVDFSILILALLAFELFWRTAMGRFRRGFLPADRQPDEVAWWRLGYALFGASCLALTTITETTPDLLSAIWVFLAAAIGLRLASSPGLASVRSGIGLGWVLGAGYLTKLALLGPGLVALALLALGRRTRKAAVGGILGLAMMMAPWVTLLSLDAGRPTVGEAGRLNLAWYVLGEGGGQHWRGDGAVHPTRLLHDDPRVHGFAEPIGGTYAPWLDPTYWHEGLELRFEPLSHLRVAVAHVGTLTVGWLLPHGLLWLAVLALARQGRRSRTHAALVAVAAVAAAGYLLVHVELRFFGPWVVLLGAGLLGHQRLADPQSRRWVHLAVVGALLPLAWSTATVVSKHADAVRDPGFNAHVDLEIAKALREAGVPRGGRIAVVGYPMDAYWARLADARIVADVFARPDLPDGTADVERFWSGGPAIREAVYDALGGEGASHVVTCRRDLPDGVDPRADGWSQLGTSPCSTRSLEAAR